MSKPSFLNSPFAGKTATKASACRRRKYVNANNNEDALPLFCGCTTTVPFGRRPSSRDAP
jgi:hypothetical protein